MPLSKATEERIVDLITESLKQAAPIFAAGITPNLPCALEEHRMTQLVTDQKELEKEVEANTKRIKGNGEGGGLEAKVTVHTEEIRVLKEFMQDVKRIGAWLVLLVAGLLVTSILNLILIP